MSSGRGEFVRREKHGELKDGERRENGVVEVHDTSSTRLIDGGVKC